MSCCDKPKVFEKKNGKVLHEFICSSCSGYITVKLDEDLNGAHCVVCPSCKHEHYRIIKDGVITEDRAPDSSKSYAIRICPTKAAYSKTSWESKLINRKTKVKEEGKHFLNDAWRRMTGQQKQTMPQKEELVPVAKKDAPKVEMAKVELAVEVPADNLTIDEKIEFYRTRKEDAIRNQDFARAGKYRDEERTLREQKEKAANPKKIKEPLHQTCLKELVAFCKSKKDSCASTEDFETAIVWRFYERELENKRLLEQEGG